MPPPATLPGAAKAEAHLPLRATPRLALVIAAVQLALAKPAAFLANRFGQIGIDFFQQLIYLLIGRNRPAEPYGSSGAAGSCTGRANRLTVEARVSGIQPLGLDGGLLGAKVSCQPLGVSCQMSLLGWLGSRRRMSWR